MKQDEKNQCDKKIMLETIKLLKSDIEAYRKSGYEMGKEISLLKSKIGGYMSANKRYKEQVQKYVNYAKEGDELNEKKAIEIFELNAELDKKERIIIGLREIIEQYKKDIAERKDKMNDMVQERDVAVANYEYVCSLPWYKRMFYKGK